MPKMKCAFPIYLAQTEFGSHHSEKLEKWIDELDIELAELTNFILPVSVIASPCAAQTTMHYTGLCSNCIHSRVGRPVPAFIWPGQFAGGQKGGEKIDTSQNLATTITRKTDSSICNNIILLLQNSSLASLRHGGRRSC